MLSNLFDKLPQCASIHARIKQSIDCMTQSSNENLIACGYINGIIKIYNHRQCKLLVQLIGHTDGIVDLSFSSDSQSLASSSQDMTIRIWKLSNKSQDIILHDIDWILTISYSPDGLFIALGGYDTEVVLCDIKTRQIVKCLKGHTHTVYKVQYSPNGKLLASGSEDKSIILWDTQTGIQLMTFIGHTKYIEDLKFTTDNKNIVSSSDDHTIRLWNIETGEQIKCFPDTQSLLYQFVIYTANKDNWYLIARTNFHYVQIWKISNGQSQQLNSYNVALQTVNLSAGENYMISACSDGVIRVHKYKFFD